MKKKKEKKSRLEAFLKKARTPQDKKQLQKLLGGSESQEVELVFSDGTETN